MNGVDRNISPPREVPGYPAGIAEIGNEGTVLFISESFYEVFKLPLPKQLPLHLHDHFGSLLEGLSLALNELSTTAGAVHSFGFDCTLKDPSAVFLDLHHLMCTLTRTNTGSVIISVSDFTETVRGRELLDKLAVELSYREAWLDTTKGLLHDIGNAISGMSLLATQMTNDDGREESDCLLRLQSYVALHRVELEKALGVNDYGALSRMLDVLKDSWESRRNTLQGNLNIIMHSVVHIGELIYLHRTYSAAPEENEKEPIDLKRVLMDSMLILYSQLEKRNVRVTFEEKTAAMLIRGNRAPLLSMFLNIIKNAYESIESRDSEVEDKNIIIALASSDSDVVSVRITDNGVGFSPEQGCRLFEKSFSTKKRSSGLGLYSCRKIVNDHGGKIWMVSDGIGRGASVFIQFPSFRLAP
jgi:signal transduction histidine kinase